MRAPLLPILGANASFRSHKRPRQAFTSSHRRTSDEEDQDERDCEDDPLDPAKRLGGYQLTAVGDSVLVAAFAATKSCGVRGNSNEPEKPTKFEQ